MKTYDFIFSLGASCACTQSLRDAGLQFASFPLDWAASPGLLQAVGMIERDFDSWFERGDLRLWDVRHEEGAVQRVYKNMRTNFGFPHEFTNAHPFDRSYEEVRTKYARRIARFMDELDSPKHVLGIYLEVATRPGLSEGPLREAHRRLRAKFPKVALDLVYIHEVPGQRMPVIESETDGVMVVGADYAKFLHGVPMHTVDRTELVRFFHERFTIAGHDVAAEKTMFDREQKRIRQQHWGRGRCERWLNRKLFKTYRRLQDYLIGQRLLPGDRPCWFEESDRVWPYPEESSHPGGMRAYDFIFSLGYACAVTQALRDLGLQRASYPLDWTGCYSPLDGARTIAADFDHWFDREDLKLWDVRFEGGFIVRVYKNVRTGFGFSHEFSNAEPIEKAYGVVKAKYDRRIVRFREKMRDSKRILAIYLEEPRRPRTPDADLLEARRLIATKFPGAEIDLLCIYEDETCRVAEKVASSDGITVVKAHYRTMLNGEVMHIADRRQIVDWLRANVTVLGAMTADEVRVLDAEKRRKLRESLGQNRIDRWVNKKLKQWYRDLELYLIGQKLIPGNRPLWFDGDGK